MVNGAWDWRRIKTMVSSAVCRVIDDEKVVLSNNEDRFIWKKDVNAIFSFAQAWELARGKAMQQPVAKAISHMTCHPKAKHFAWKMFHTIVVTDDKIQGLGIALPSRCSCCFMQEETRDHVFISGPLAVAVWSAMSSLLGFRIFDNESPVVRLMRLWRCFKKMNIQHVAVRNVAPIVFWNVWKERCSRIYDNKRSVSAWVIKQIRWQLAWVVKKHDRISVVSYKDKELQQLWKTTTVRMQRSFGRQIAWVMPPAGWLKLNIDGAAKGNPGASGGGSILRNDRGEMLFATSQGYGVLTNSSAEFLALLDGLKALIESGFGDRDIIIETDSTYHLFMFTNEGSKTRFLMELIRLSVTMNEKVLVFSQFIDPLNLIMDQLCSIFNWKEGKEVLQMQGRLYQEHRQSMINIFNDPGSKARILLASTKACSEGINLVGASRVVLLDVVWNPSVERQAISRAYRLGQTKMVYTYHLIMLGTSEWEKYCKQAEKDRLSELVFSSNDKENEKQKTSLELSEDKILDEMISHEKLKGMFERIIYQPKESKLFETFT